MKIFMVPLTNLDPLKLAAPGEKQTKSLSRKVSQPISIISSNLSLFLLLSISVINANHISCFGINKVLDVLTLVSLSSRSMPKVSPIIVQTINSSCLAFNKIVTNPIAGQKTTEQN